MKVSNQLLMTSRKGEKPVAVLDSAGNPLIINRNYQYRDKEVKITSGRQVTTHDYYYKVYFDFVEQAGVDKESPYDYVEASYPEGKSGPVQYKSDFHPL